MTDTVEAPYRPRITDTAMTRERREVFVLVLNTYTDPSWWIRFAADLSPETKNRAYRAALELQGALDEAEEIIPGEGRVFHLKPMLEFTGDVIKDWAMVCGKSGNEAALFSPLLDYWECWSCHSEGQPCRAGCTCVRCVEPEAFENWRRNNPASYERAISYEREAAVKNAAWKAAHPVMG